MSHDAPEAPEWVASGIADALAPRSASPTRYPYTYAYDFLRSHSQVFGVPKDVAESRAEVAGWLLDRLEVREGHPLAMTVLRQLADAYLAEHNEVLPGDATR